MLCQFPVQFMYLYIPTKKLIYPQHFHKQPFNSTKYSVRNSSGKDFRNLDKLIDLRIVDGRKHRNTAIELT